jgi:type III restriction enzyme
MNRHINAIARRLSVRPPQHRSIETLDRITEIVPQRWQLFTGSFHQSVTERDFPSVQHQLK